MKINKAVFLVAGFGTRFLPATKAMPKELLPIVDKPLIQYAVEEAITAGIDTLIFVTGRNKRAIEDYFDMNDELDTMLRTKGKDVQADMVRNIIPTGVECIFVRQAEQLGLGHAVLCAERAVGAAVKGGLNEFNEAAEGTRPHKYRRQSNAPGSGQREGECRKGNEVYQFVAAVGRRRRGLQGSEHRDRQNEGDSEGDWDVEVFSHYVQLMVTEIKRNNWFRKQGRL